MFLHHRSLLRLVVVYRMLVNGVLACISGKVALPSFLSHPIWSQRSIQKLTAGMYAVWWKRLVSRSFHFGCHPRWKETVVMFSLAHKVFLVYLQLAVHSGEITEK